MSFRDGLGDKREASPLTYDNDTIDLSAIYILDVDIRANFEIDVILTCNVQYIQDM